MKGFTEEDANWISGGATSFVHVPHMLRMSRRTTPLRGSLLDGLTPKLPGETSVRVQSIAFRSLGPTSPIAPSPG